MKIITINGSVRTTTALLPVNNVHLWYDPKIKKMSRFVGGQLQFTYNPQTKSQAVSVMPMKARQSVKRNSIWSIREWFDTYSDFYDLAKIEDTDRRLSFTVNDDRLDDVTAAVYEQGFDYDLEEYDSEGSSGNVARRNRTRPDAR
jgi:hypothetical protein